MKLQTIHTKVFLWSALFIFLLFLFLAFAVGSYLSTTQKNALRDNIQSSAGYTAKIISSPLWDFDMLQVKSILENTAKNPNIVSVTLIDEFNNKISSADGSTKNIRTKINYTENVVVKHDSEEKIIGRLDIIATTDMLAKDSRKFFTFAFFAFSASMALFFVFNRGLLRKVLLPVSQLSEKMANYAPESGEVAMPEATTQEMYNLIQAYRHMKEANDSYNERLTTEVRERTEELYDYKMHLEDIIEVQVQDLRVAIAEAEEAGKAKAEFLSNMSHELRTPLHAIINFAQIATDRVNKDSKEHAIKCMGNIDKSAKRLLMLVNDILDLSKLEAGKQEFVFSSSSLKAMIEDSIAETEVLMKERNVTCEIFSECTDFHVDMDSRRMMQVAINVLSNAIKFSPQNGKITILISDDGEDVKCIISDEGVGIPESELENIFDKFIQSSATKTNAGGTGLGLSICREILSAHNGTIWAENKPQGGASFIFKLPRKRISEKQAA